MSPKIHFPYHIRGLSESGGEVQMTIKPGSSISTLLFLPVIGLMLVSIANAQTNSGASAQETVATVTNSPARNTAAANAPVFTDYRGISIGMSAEEVRSTLNNLKKDKTQDVFVFSEKESAQIYYDDKGKVSAISID